MFVFICFQLTNSINVVFATPVAVTDESLVIPIANNISLHVIPVPIENTQPQLLTLTSPVPISPLLAVGGLEC